MSESEMERVGVRTYVPRYQKDDWAAEAAELDMSQAEYVRTMVQAGRRSFTLDNPGGPESGDEPGSPDATPGVERLEARLIDILESEGHLSWDELLAALTDNIEDRLEETLTKLQEQGRVTHSGRQGGYSLTDGE